METLEQQFNSRVRVFLGRTGLSPTDRVLAFMADYDLDSGGPRTPPRGHRRRKPSSGARRTRRSRAMTEQPMEQRTNPPTRFLRRPEVDEWIRERIAESRDTESAAH